MPCSIMLRITKLRRSKAREGILVRRIEIRPANHPRQQGGLRRGQAAHVLVEVGVGRFPKAIDGKPTTLPQIDLIREKLKNLFLIQPLLQQMARKTWFILRPNFRCEVSPKMLRASVMVRVLPPCGISSDRNKSCRPEAKMR